METDVLDFAFGVFTTLCVLLILAMLCLGPQILEWVEGAPPEIG